MMVYLQQVLLHFLITLTTEHVIIANIASDQLGILLAHPLYTVSQVVITLLSAVKMQLIPQLTTCDLIRTLSIIAPAETDHTENFSLN